MISLSSDLSCPKPENHPLEINSMSGAFVNGEALVCGGRAGDYLKDCYSYSFEKNNWKKSPFALSRGKAWHRSWTRAVGSGPDFRILSAAGMTTVAGSSTAGRPS